ncbi:MAG: thiol-disulfide isomerase/thioredoxin [Glaciecola sp.]|jgi:thiol-disulfide isomerase/thioredoxin
MKKPITNISILLLAITFLHSCKQEEKIEPTIVDSYTVSGTIKALDTEFMTYSYEDETGKRVWDSIFVENDHFSHTAKITEPTLFFIWPNVERTIKTAQSGGYYPVKSSQLVFLASPGDDIVFKGEATDFINAYPSGTKANDDLASINNKVFPLMNRSVNYMLEMESLDETDARRILIQDSIDLLDKQVVDLKKEFVTSHLKSEAATWYLADMMLRSQIEDDDAITAFKAFDPELQDYRYYQEVATRVKGIEATLIGKLVDNFTTDATFSGEIFEFNSLRGKYVLIDFWGTWCGPCIEEMPKVKAYQEKYAGKLTVLGINQGDTKGKIEKFITPNGYTWTHLMDGKGAANFVFKFNVAGFPTKFIVDPEGKVLHRFVGNGEEAFTVLDALLK